MWLELALLLAALSLSPACGYLLLLTLCSRRLATPKPAGPSLRFAIVVPAHNEAAVIERTVSSLLALDWPAAQRRIVVVADNCKDHTAELACAAGAEVWERQHDSERGKGYALRFAYERLLAESDTARGADAVVVVDADTEVSANLLSAFAARIEAGAGAAQAFYGALNPTASWRTRLMTIALSLIHRLRGRGRERLGVSAGLKGNGMMFTLDTLSRAPHRSFSLVEDLEYAIQLGHAGIRVAYVDEAEVLGEMVSTGAAAASQRQRWEGGRRALIREHGLPLLRAAIARRSALLLDLAFDVLVPPLATLVVLAAPLGFAAAAAIACGSSLWLVLALLPLVSLIAYVLRGVAISGLGLQGWRDLALAPLYIVWKLGLRLKPADKAWVRTQREAESTRKDDA
ncbi:MAG: glycosyltransferase family 2 protein [Pseudomonadota bacterium]